MTAFFTSLSIIEYIFLFCGAIGSLFFVLRTIALLLGIAGSSNVDAIEGNSIESANSLLQDLDGNGVPDVLETGGVDSVEISSPHDLIQDINGNRIPDIIESNEVHLKLGKKFIEFSVQNTCAFLMMFGFVGLTMTKYSGLNPFSAIIGGFVAGTFSAWLFTKVMQALMKLDCSGNKIISSAIGKKGKVYLDIPANGVGKIEVEVSERLDIKEAVSLDNKAIPFGREVMVVDIKEGNILVVKETNQDQFL